MPVSQSLPTASQPETASNIGLKVVTPATATPPDVNKKGCLTCLKVVWIGEPSCAPRAVGNILAHPLGTDWQHSNMQPYCQECWEEETAVLDSLSADHCAKGGKRKKKKMTQVVDKNAIIVAAGNKAIAVAVAKAGNKAVAVKKKNPKAVATKKKGVAAKKKGVAAKKKGVAAKKKGVAVKKNGVAAKKKSSKIVVNKKKVKKKQLGGVQTTMEAALETAIVKETENNDPVEEVSPPVTPWAVSPSFYYGW